MIIRTSLMEELLNAQLNFRPQMYFKSSLTALSHAMEDQVMAGDEPCLIIASFQRERFYRQEAHRYQRIAEKSDQVYILAAPEAEFANHSGSFETVAFDAKDGLSQEWHLVVVGEQYATSLICREHPQSAELSARPPLVHIDQSRRFEGIWTFDRKITCTAARLCLQRIRRYRPELKTKIAQALTLVDRAEAVGGNQVDPGPFADRLVMYLQAGQYKQNKAYRQIAAQERKERLINSITQVIRCSLDPAQILSVAATELGQTLHSDRCLIYRCQAKDMVAQLQYEYVSHGPPLKGQTWPLRDNALFETLVKTQAPLYIAAVRSDPMVPASLRTRLLNAEIVTLLMVPVLYQGQLLGVVELHLTAPITTPDSLDSAGIGFNGSDSPPGWNEADQSLVAAIATQVGVALIQAQAYAELEDLNQQLAALDRTRSNLIAITGHELRTPLSTIQVCLESLASEPDMPVDLQQVMLSTAITDAERMRKLIQDFLTLSQLESGRVEWNPEPLEIQEIVELSLSSIRLRNDQVPKISADVPRELPLIRGDGEWLVEVLTKLIDNACKFTDRNGKIDISAHANGSKMLEVTVSDTGRGIEPNRLETIFERFYQEEGALRRSAGGTGLGLAICRQIINNLGGSIWAESAGKDQGSRFHFTVPIAEIVVEKRPAAKKATRTRPK
jgi:DICT domain-containing protein/signal transduction histidine kinase